MDERLDVTCAENAEMREKMRTMRKKVEKQVGGSRKSLAAAQHAIDWLVRVIREKDFKTDQKFQAAGLLLDYAVADGQNAILKKKAATGIMDAERDAANAAAKVKRAEVVVKRMSNREILLRAKRALGAGVAEGDQDGIDVNRTTDQD